MSEAETGRRWVTGSVATHDGLCRRLAHEVKCRVVSVEYRLAPEHPFPAVAEDAVTAARFILSRAEEFGIDPARVAVAGDSAGGNLSAIIAIETRGDARRPRLQVLIYPALDMTCSTESYRTFAAAYYLTRQTVDWYLYHYVGHGDVRNPQVSPRFSPYVSDVPALIYTAGFDVLRDEARNYADRLAGRQYVGSAGGEAGFWGRWEAYAASGHGGNIRMLDVPSADYWISVLEVASSLAGTAELVASENRWKEKLGSRTFGLNAN